jgi:hypothetical protein
MANKGDDTASDGAPGAAKRANRRVTANPSGVSIDPAFGDEPIAGAGEDYADRTPTNDEQLKRDKPPHWG